MFRLSLNIVFLFLASNGFGQNLNHDLLSYELDLLPNAERRSIKGRVTIAFRQAEGSAALTLDVGGLAVDRIMEDGLALSYERREERLIIDLDRNVEAETRNIEIHYHGSPQRGLFYTEARDQIFTAFATSQWMPTIDSPQERAQYRLSITLPEDDKLAATGELISEQAVEGGNIKRTWHQETPVPSYLVGFAAGRFREVVDRESRPFLRFLAPGEFSEAQIRDIFRETRNIIAFFEDKSGISYPQESYTQVLLKMRGGQELAGLALLGERYGRQILEDDTQIWLIAHELAHQWWGNMVTNESWRHFWLNEGIANFMSFAFLESRFGKEVYQGYIDAAEGMYKQVKQSGNDKSLVFSDWDNPSAEDRSLVYDKGSYVLHLLREKLGEEVFWRAFRHYTRLYWGKSVSSRDFQKAMEASSGAELSIFFKRWIYLQE